MVESTQPDVSPGQRHIIKRPRLTRLLDEAEARIILLIAPAGYGKTTLAREWVSARGRKYGWYQARDDAVDPVALALGIGEALEAFIPGAAATVREYVSASQTSEPDPDVLADLLAQEAADWPHNGWLVIDDYHVLVGATPSERMVERFVDRARARVLITSRKSVNWLPARTIVYGGAFALGKHSLAMNDSEARAVLAHRPESSIQGLVEVAEGWPAVIGLAAASSVSPPTVEASETLYEFLAQELFDALTPSTRRTLVPLAVLPSLDTELLRDLFADDAEAVIQEATKVGLLTARPGGSIEMHPLVRTFLQGKLNTENVPADLEDHLASYFIEHRRWDDAFSVIRRSRLVPAFVKLARAGLEDLLAHGRTATIDRWLRFAREHEIDAPELTLARAETALRRGDWSLAESLALACAPHLTHSRLGGEAFLCAGTAAHLSDEYERGFGYFSKALDLSQSARDQHKAAWGRFLTALHQDPARAAGLVREFEALPDVSPTHIVRVTQAQLFLALKGGDLNRAVEGAVPVLKLLSDVSDPLVRSGFTNTLANCLILTGRYSEAGEVAEEELAEAKRFQLRFVVPYALINLALARGGLGDFAGATVLLDEAREVSVGDDPFALPFWAVALARIQLGRRDFRAACRTLEIDLHERVISHMRSEFHATRALAYAANGELIEAERALEIAGSFSKNIDAIVLIEAARAVMEFGRGGVRLEAALRDLVRAIRETGNVDGAICAFRTEPRLLRRLIEAEPFDDIIAEILRGTRDPALAAAANRPLPRWHPTAVKKLSQRECEILSLTAQGLRNQEIAERLFLSPKTIKTHLRNIFEKLDVHTRTEAVVKAKEIGIL